VRGDLLARTLIIDPDSDGSRTRVCMVAVFAQVIGSGLADGFEFKHLGL
jgi:hypothetical protein